MKKFEHPDVPGLVVEANPERELLLKPSGWVEIDSTEAVKK